MRKFILDTNILMAYFKSKDTLVDKINNDNKLNEDDVTIMISCVTKGEISSIAFQRQWGAKKMTLLKELLNKLIVIDVTGDDEKLLNAYAEIDAFSKCNHPTKKLSGSAVKMAKNDLWIAATAYATDATLITTDGDFTHLDEEFIDLKSYKPNGESLKVSR